MLFRRKKKKSDEANERAHYRTEISGSNAILATIIPPSGFVAEGMVCDLSIQGAGVQIAYEADPGLEPGDVVELIMRNTERGWTVQTPIRICQIHHEGTRYLIYGCQFINLGNLYSQLENALGKYFNRRHKVRVRPELSNKIIANLRHEARRMRAPIYDVSLHGIGVAIHGYQAEWVTPGSLIEVRFHLPGVRKELEGEAYVRHLNPLTSHTLVGLEFELENPEGFTRHTQRLEAYVEKRAVAVDKFESEWAGSGIYPVDNDMSKLTDLLSPPPGTW